MGASSTCNPAAETITQYDAAALRSMSVGTWCPMNVRTRHAALRQGFALRPGPMAQPARPAAAGRWLHRVRFIELAGITVAGRRVRPSTCGRAVWGRAPAAPTTPCKRESSAGSGADEPRGSAGTPLSAVLGVVCSWLMLEAPSGPAQLAQFQLRIRSCAFDPTCWPRLTRTYPRTCLARWRPSPAWPLPLRRPSKVGSLADQAIATGVADRANGQVAGAVQLRVARETATCRAGGRRTAHLSQIRQLCADHRRRPGAGGAGASTRAIDWSADMPRGLPAA